MTKEGTLQVLSSASGSLASGSWYQDGTGRNLPHVASLETESGALWPLLQMRVTILVSPGLVSPGLVSLGLVSPGERGAEWGAGHVGSAR